MQKIWEWPGNEARGSGHRGSLGTKRLTLTPSMTEPSISISASRDDIHGSTGTFCVDSDWTAGPVCSPDPPDMGTPPSVCDGMCCSVLAALLANVSPSAAVTPGGPIASLGFLHARFLRCPPPPPPPLAAAITSSRVESTTCSCADLTI